MDATCYWMPHSYIERHSSDKSLTQYGITWARLLMELWYINVNILAYHETLLMNKAALIDPLRSVPPKVMIDLQRCVGMLGI
ncbi:uncharacterized protein BYT42DRAFT_170501 [Radiomyces spectabilis]|uniref:uncharacterized protein n=1 Tax=Radiomyces spectabilis TaxID=64574 RepID=UPI00221F4AB0|nr:uncharacterized protein BYT42DRAFT_170501 [Radiomyces spectabilis]KAI8364806.1 hypothetical protein BYT42DRAFT_170501 [Radiomyces spectabilis]